ncbi:MAG: zf-HC2 domain-containing protein [Candidatus Tectomicrobia bacterium]|nr:zf-HC2 domain-containing protein [Candidatus Tectomicrobia bacterium]
MHDNIDAPHTENPSPLTCQRVTDAIMDYISGDMAPETTAVFESHLRRCSDCDAFFNTYRGTLRATRSLAYDNIPPELSNRVLQFLHNAIQKPPSANP